MSLQIDLDRTLPEDAFDFAPMPDTEGNFGRYGGAKVPPPLVPVLKEISEAYMRVSQTKDYQEELAQLLSTYVSRPSPLYFAKRLTEKCGGAKIYFKREDLDHTGAHKINHCLGEALLAKHLGKTLLLAETGAGQHGVALATAGALVGLPVEIHMGEIDVEKEAPNVTRMKILGAKVVPVTQGGRCLKDAVDSAFGRYMSDPVNIFYAIGSVVGPAPFPAMVRDFQSVIGREAREQYSHHCNDEAARPNFVVACVGGGSNAIGIFSAFLNDRNVRLIGVEPSGEGLDSGRHAATMTVGSPGTIHGFDCHVLQDEQGEPLPVHTVASGLDYPGVGPQHSYLHDKGRVEYVHVGDQDCLSAFLELSRVEGIIPALESSHAIAYAMRLAAALPQDKSVLVNLSGRGDKDIDFAASRLDLN
ncbi:MAG: Tryptophan synthase beta chain 2 [Cercozoa sp. M6MM]